MEFLYEELANAIVIQAAEDYRDALRHIQKFPRSKCAKAEVEELETFFLSGWCKELTAVDGKKIMERIQKEQTS